jgi:hypothetical protein
MSDMTLREYVKETKNAWGTLEGVVDTGEHEIYVTDIEEDSIMWDWTVLSAEIEKVVKHSRVRIDVAEGLEDYEPDYLEFID